MCFGKGYSYFCVQFKLDIDTSSFKTDLIIIQNYYDYFGMKSRMIMFLLDL